MVDRDRFEPVRSTVALLAAVRSLVPDHFAWRPPPYEYEAELMPIDILWGHDSLRTGIDEGASIEDILAGLDDELEDFGASVEPFLLYE